MRRRTHRAGAGPAATVRSRKGFVQIEVHNIHPKIARFGKANQRVKVGAVHI